MIKSEFLSVLYTKFDMNTQQKHSQRLLLRKTHPPGYKNVFLKKDLTYCCELGK